MVKQVGHDVTINSKEYLICSWGAEPRKITSCDIGMGVTLEIQIMDKDTKEFLKWSEIRKDPYLMEKISDFAHNSFNGQNSFYWDWNKHKEDK